MVSRGHSKSPDKVANRKLEPLLPLTIKCTYKWNVYNVVLCFITQVDIPLVSVVDVLEAVDAEKAPVLQAMLAYMKKMVGRSFSLIYIAYKLSILTYEYFDKMHRSASILIGIY